MGFVVAFSRGTQPVSTAPPKPCIRIPFFEIHHIMPLYTMYFVCQLANYCFVPLLFFWDKGITIL